MEVKVDYDKIREIAALGVRRASVFMGIGTNVGKIYPPVSHQLDDRAQYIFVASNVPEKDRRAFIDEFQNWIIANGLRELVETYSVFLTASYQTYLLVESGGIAVAELAKKTSEFERDNVSVQLETLTKSLGVKNTYGDMFDSLRQARNCLSHRMGVVSPKDVNTNDGQFLLRWHYQALFAIEESGKETLLDLNRTSEDGITLETPGKIVMRPHVKEKATPLGSPIRLDRHELSEICWAVQVAGDYIHLANMEFAKSKGVNILPKENQQPAAP